ncbi:winged helix-turn-helix domain-containing protein [Candidatus Woesearchaeota archaeon]|nr:winged helix-turn-helix domain-containing protein [Candidatus Woesearchaeota archaeon]
MKKSELVYREILYQSIEKKNRVLTQAELARTLKLSLSVINKSVKLLDKMGAVEIRQRSLHIIDIKKTLYYWASIRNLQKDIVYSTRVELPVKEIEKQMPNNIVFGAYSAYKFLFKDVSADYSEVYVYGDETLKERFPSAKGPPNLFVLKKDDLIEKYGKTTTIANTFVDLWNLKEWYAKEFLKNMEEKLHGILE